MTRRYFVPELPTSGGLLSLPDDEAQHASRVMRLGVGDTVVLFTGDGRESTGQVVTIDRRQVSVDVQPPREVSRELEFSIEVDVSLPRGDRAKWLIEKLTELGVNRITPLICEHTQAPPSEKGLEKLRRLVVEASKQCGRNRLMIVEAPRPFDQVLQSAPQTRSPHPTILRGNNGRSLHPPTASSDDEDPRVPRSPAPSDVAPQRWIAHPGGAPLGAASTALRASDVRVLIGPEGGFTNAEVSAAESAGWKRMGLGRAILRVETAAIAAVAGLISSMRV